MCTGEGKHYAHGSFYPLLSSPSRTATPSKLLATVLYPRHAHPGLLDVSRIHHPVLVTLPWHIILQGLVKPRWGSVGLCRAWNVTSLREPGRAGDFAQPDDAIRHKQSIRTSQPASEDAHR